MPHNRTDSTRSSGGSPENTVHVFLKNVLKTLVHRPKRMVGKRVANSPARIIVTKAALLSRELDTIGAVYYNKLMESDT